MNTESPLTIHLAQGISKNEKMDFAIQKAVELGISVITPLITEFCAVKLDHDRLIKRLEHWRKIIISACEQSGRTHLPVINPPQEYSLWLENDDSELKLYCDPSAIYSIQDLAPAKQVSVLVGPEGGLSKTEIELADKKMCIGIRLGSRILRTETAALAVISVIQNGWGDLN